MTKSFLCGNLNNEESFWKNTAKGCKLYRKVSQNKVSVDTLFLDAWTVSYEITLVRLLSVRLSVCLTITKLSQEWIISFFWYCTWWWLTMLYSDWRGHIVEKTFGGQNLSPAGPKMKFFGIFHLRFFGIVHLLILR